MDANGHTGHKLEDLSGVPSATTHRFLKGTHKQPTDDTISRWAKVYKVTKAQLRGEEPIQHVLIPPSTPDSSSVQESHFSHLTREEKTTLKILGRLRREPKKLWLRLGIELSDPPENAADAADVKALLAKTGHIQRREERRQLPDRRMGGGSSYAPAKQQAAADKGKNRA